LSALQEERAARQEEQAKTAGLQTQLDQLQQYVQQIAPQQGNAGTTYPQAGQVAPQGTNADQRARIDKLWAADPKQAVQAEIDASLVQYDQVSAQVEAQANFLAQKHPDFNNYRTTAMNYIRTLPYSQRAQDGIVELAYMVARGQNVDSVVQAREAELMEKFKTGQLAGALHQPAGATGTPITPQAGQITADQHAAAQAMGLSDEDYIANMSSGAT
jgi:tellurite resistance protein